MHIKAKVFIKPGALTIFPSLINLIIFRFTEWAKVRNLPAIKMIIKSLIGGKR